MQRTIGDEILLNMAINHVEQERVETGVVVMPHSEENKAKFKNEVKELFELFREIHAEVFGSLEAKPNEKGAILDAIYDFEQAGQLSPQTVDALRRIKR